MADQVGSGHSYAGEHSTANDNPNLKSEKEILQDIMKCLLHHSKHSRHESERAHRRSDVKSLNDLCSTYAVIAVFIASLGVAFISYGRDTFSDRAPDAPEKITDQVVFIFWFLSIILAIASILSLGIGSSTAIVAKLKFITLERFYSHSLNRSISPRILTLFEKLEQIEQLAPASPLFLALRVTLMLAGPQRRNVEDNDGAKDLDGRRGSQEAPSSLRIQNTNGGRQPSPKEDSKSQDTSQMVNIASRIKSSSRAEETFIILMILLALYLLANSLIFLLVGLEVFVWAEHPRSVSITITLALLIFGVVFNFTQFSLTSVLKRRLMNGSSDDVDD